MHRLFILSTFSLLYIQITCGIPIPQRSGPAAAAMAKFEQMNVDAILKSDRLLSTYMDCLLDKGKCSKNGQELKNILPVLISSKCIHCTPAQRTKVVKVMTHLSVHKPDTWKKLKEKYAPTTSLSEFGLKSKRNTLKL